MITIPTVLSYKDIAVYPDDADCNLFYCIRTTPRIRVENGIPVFSGTFYSDKADGKMESTSGITGALINFDANLAISDEDYENIRQQIKKGRVQEARVRVLEKKNEQRQYYRNKVKGKDGAIAGEDPTGYHVPEIGEVRFGSIDFKEGNVELLEEAHGDLVAWSSSGGRCSGFGDNNAAFALRLSHMGGAVWYKALKERSKAFGIRYNLKFDIRVPALEIKMYAASHQKSDIKRDVERIWKNVDKGCTDADVERIDCHSVAQTLVDESVVNIEIIQGSSDIPLEDVNRIRESMVSLLKDMIEEIIKSKIQGMTREQMETSMIETMSEEINSFAELRFTQESVLEWSIAPQGTIMDFMEGVPENALNRVITLVDISQTVLPTVEVEVRAAAPWDEAPFVTSVQVDLEYVSTGEHKSYLLNKEYNYDKWMFRPDKKELKDKKDKGIVRYTATVWTKDKKDPFVMPTVETTGHVFVNVGKIGMADIMFVPHPSLALLSGNNKVTGISVETRYRTKEERLQDEKEIKAGKAQETKRGIVSAFSMTPDNVEGHHFFVNFGKLLDEPLLYQVTYNFKNRAPITMPLSQYYFSDGVASQVLTPNPFSDTLGINVEVNGSIRNNEDVIKATVSLRYIDEKNDFESTDCVILSKEDDWEASRASLVIVDKSNSKYQYKYTLMMTDSFYQSEWIDKEGEVEPIILSAPNTFIVDTGILGTAGTDYYRAQLHVDFENEGLGDLDFNFDKKESNEVRNWCIPKEFEGVELKYKYTFKYWDKRGKQTTMAGEDTGNLLMIVLPDPEETKPAAEAASPVTNEVKPESDESHA